LTQAISALVGDSDMRRRFGCEGRERFARQFEHQEMARQLRELYLRVLAR